MSLHSLSVASNGAIVIKPTISIFSNSENSGNLQRRKVKQVINYVDYFHALDSLKLAQEINKRAEHTIKCFIELNISGEESKHGFSVNELMEILPE